MKNTKKEEKVEKKKYSAFSFFSGLILIIIAVGLVLVKNGVNLFGNSDTPDETFVKANMGICDTINEELLEYLSYCGTNARANGGHLISVTEVNTEKQLVGSNDSLLGSLIGAIGLDQLAVKEGYSLKNEDGLVTVVRQSDNSTVYTKETILYGLDFSKLGKTSALKEKTIKKLLTTYEKMFFQELLKSGYGYSKDELVNIDEIYLLGHKYSIEYTNEDISRALEAVLDNIAGDKKWKKAYEAMEGGDFDEFMGSVKERLLGNDSLLQSIHSIKGSFYVRSDSSIYFTELTFDVDDKAIERRLTENASWLVKTAVDIDPVFTLTAGCTYQADARGFKFSIVNAENVTRIDVTGHGTVNKTGIFDGKVSGFTGTASLSYKGKRGTLAMTDAQIVDLKHGFRVNGSFAIVLDNMGIVLEADASNDEQNCSYQVSISGKNYMIGSMKFTEK